MKKKVAVGASLLAVLLTLPTTASFAATQKGKSPEPVVTSLSVYSTVGPMLKLTGRNFSAQDQIAIFSSGVNGGGPFFHLGYPQDRNNYYGEAFYDRTSTSLLVEPVAVSGQPPASFPVGDQLVVEIKDPQTGVTTRDSFRYEPTQSSFLWTILGKTPQEIEAHKFLLFKLALQSMHQDSAVQVLGEAHAYYLEGVNWYDLYQALEPFMNSNPYQYLEVEATESVIATDPTDNMTSAFSSSLDQEDAGNILIANSDTPVTGETLQYLVKKLGWSKYLSLLSNSTAAQQFIVPIPATTPGGTSTTISLQLQEVDAVAHLEASFANFLINMG